MYDIERAEFHFFTDLPIVNGEEGSEFSTYAHDEYADIPDTSSNVALPMPLSQEEDIYDVPKAILRDSIMK